MKLKTRVGNKQKAEKNLDASPPAPQKRRVDGRYAPIDTTALLDNDVHKRNLIALDKELSKPKPIVCLS